jgi:hypothetical protein
MLSKEKVTLFARVTKTGHLTRVWLIVKLGVVDVHVNHLFLRLRVVVGVQRHCALITWQLVDARAVAWIDISSSWRERIRGRRNWIVFTHAALQLCVGLHVALLAQRFAVLIRWNCATDARSG